MSQIEVKQFYSNIYPMEMKIPLGYVPTVYVVMFQFDIMIHVDGSVRIIYFN